MAGRNHVYSTNKPTDKLSTSFQSKVNINFDDNNNIETSNPLDLSCHPLQHTVELSDDTTQPLIVPPPTTSTSTGMATTSDSSMFLSPNTALHQQSIIQRRLSTGNSPHGDGAASDILVKAIDNATSITAKDLALLLTPHVKPLLIDIRYQPNYDYARIRGSIHVNMPTLLLKRYRRGTVSNFSLESFITTPQAIDHYTQWLKQQKQQQNDRSNLVVVYDDHMDITDKSTSAWTLVGALSKFFSGDMDGEDNIKAKVVWLQGGYTAFEQWDTKMEYIDRQSPEYQQQRDIGRTNGFEDEPFNSTRQGDLSTLWNNNDDHNLSVPKVVPVLSRSATTFSSAPHLVSNSNIQRRASLFTLDTSNVRNKHRSPPQLQSTTIGSSTFTNRRRRQDRNPLHDDPVIPSDILPSTSTSTTTSIHNNAPSIPASSPINKTQSIPSTIPAKDNEKPGIADNDDHSMEYHDVYDDGLESEQEPTPLTENEYAFIVSAIVPDFLYLGPEISTVEQMDGLKQRSIRRILNMAEECDDDVPGLKDSFRYSKLAARDTVEMQDVESTLRKAVQIIDDAKQHHEAIYVHCKAGKSRSVAVILAYFVLSEHWSLRRAYRHVIKQRPWVSPNIGFVAELMKLEESVLGHASNFAGTDWHQVDVTSPPSPASQKEIRLIQRAWRTTSQQSSTQSLSRRYTTS